jgi:hypothetical protein
VGIQWKNEIERSFFYILDSGIIKKRRGIWPFLAPFPTRHFLLAVFFNKDFKYLPLFCRLNQKAGLTAGRGGGWKATF